MIKIVSVDDILVLRQTVLRPGHAIDTCLFKEDFGFKSYHLALYKESKLVACLSLYGQSPSMETSEREWRLRGMAVAPSKQHQGLGSQLLKRALVELGMNAVESLWCNARESAVNFYLRHGFECLGEPFEIPKTGIHYRMYIPI